MAEWQTRRTQNPLLATTCGFKSHHRYHFLTLGVNFASGVLCILFEKVTGFCLNLLKNKKHTRFLQEFSQNHWFVFSINVLCTRRHSLSIKKFQKVVFYYKKGFWYRFQKKFLAAYVRNKLESLMNLISTEIKWNRHLIALEPKVI